MLQQLAESSVPALPPALDQLEENTASNHLPDSNWCDVVVFTFIVNYEDRSACQLKDMLEKVNGTSVLESQKTHF